LISPKRCCRDWVREEKRLNGSESSFSRFTQADGLFDTFIQEAMNVVFPWAARPVTRINFLFPFFSRRAWRRGRYNILGKKGGVILGILTDNFIRTSSPAIV
jgi:hypothetical protein